MQRPQRLLNHNTEAANPQHGPQPLIPKLLHLRPESILFPAELLKLDKLLGLRLRVAPRLVGLFLLVAADEAQEEVVCDWAEQLDGRKHVGAVEERDEGEVHERVAEVAA